MFPYPAKSVSGIKSYFNAVAEIVEIVATFRVIPDTYLGSESAYL